MASNPRAPGLSKVPSSPKAMSEALLKATDYTIPMNLRFPSTRCISFQEHQRPRPTEHYLCNVHEEAREGIRRQGDAEIMHDELSSIMLDDEDAHRFSKSRQRYGYEIEDSKAEAFGLEPQSIEVGSDVFGDFVVIERGLLRAILGSLFELCKRRGRRQF